MQYDDYIRLGSFAAVFILIAAWEIIAPKRVLSTSKNKRWLSNLTITIINPLIVRSIFPVIAVAMAIKAEKMGWGLLNHVELPGWIELVIGIFVLDLVIYLQHVLFHALPLFWRLHMIHHSDLDYDLTTGLRFHPFEIIISMVIKLSAIVTIGPSGLAVLLFEIILNATSMFNHGNILLSKKADKLLRLFIVTPDMHRVHHSVIIRETNSNFGFNLPWWDRLFGTYRDQPSAGHQNMVIGLAQFRNSKKLTLPWILALPFLGVTGDYPLSRKGKEPKGKVGK